MPDAVSGIFILLISMIVPPANTTGFQIIFNFIAFQTEQRADNASPDSLNPAKSFQSAPPEEVQQHGLRPVLRIVRNGNLISAELFHRLPERAVAQPPPRVLLRAFLPRGKRRYIHGHEPERYTVLFAEPPHKCRVLVGSFPPDTVVHMHDCQPGRHFFPIFQQQK